MPDVFLYSGEPSPNDVRLRDPLVPDSGGSVNVTPGTGQLVITGFAPTVQTPQNATPGTGSLILTGFAPTVQTPQNSTPGLGQLILTGFAPIVDTGGGAVNVLIGTGALVLTGFAPTVDTGSVTQDSPKYLYSSTKKEGSHNKKYSEQDEIIKRILKEDNEIIELLKNIYANQMF